MKYDFGTVLVNIFLTDREIDRNGQLSEALC